MCIIPLLLSTAAAAHFPSKFARFSQNSSTLCKNPNQRTKRTTQIGWPSTHHSAKQANFYTSSASSSSPREPWSVLHSPVTRTNHADFLGCCHCWVWPLELLPARRHSKAQGTSIYTRHTARARHTLHSWLVCSAAFQGHVPFYSPSHHVHERQGGCWFSKFSWQIFSNILKPYKTNEIVTWCFFCGKQQYMNVV